MRFLLDTNVLSDVRRNRASSLSDWLAKQRLSDLLISVVTVLELEQGVLRIERRDPAAGNTLRSWLDSTVLPAFKRNVLPIDLAIATTAAQLHVPDPMPRHDALIAATALEQDLTLVTRNVKDFERTGARILDSSQL